jgi:hypothetical protein
MPATGGSRHLISRYPGVDISEGNRSTTREQVRDLEVGAFHPVSPRARLHPKAKPDGTVFLTVPLLRRVSNCV